MDTKRFTGPEAGSQKYDLLTAIAVAGLNGTAGFQTSMLRLVALVTARYNWKLDEFSVGQRDLARMWSVDERTVKREIKRLTEAEVLLQLRPGVRGRVAAYRLNRSRIESLSAPHWNRVGPDFAERMTRTQAPPSDEKVLRVDFRPRATEAPSPWSRVLARLGDADPGLHRNWFIHLDYSGFQDDVLTLEAASSFVAQYVQTHHLQLLQGIAAIEFQGLRRVVITVAR